MKLYSPSKLPIEQRKIIVDFSSETCKKKKDKIFKIFLQPAT